jgi:uncharacterized small protein (DUF1192 family)
MDPLTTDNRDLASIVLYLEERVEALEREIERLNAELAKSQTETGAGT